MFRSGRAPLHALVPLLLTLVAVPAAASERDPASARTETPGHAADDDLLPRPLRGRAAVDRLGPDLPEAAARNDLSTRALREVLTTDRTARLDTAGRLHHVEPGQTGQAGTTASLADYDPPESLDQTFALHSRPGANKVIYLDVDGATVSGTEWNDGAGVGTDHPAWDPQNDGPAFSDSELLRVQYLWALVAEDFAPWDVDVTTEDPGADALVKSSDADPTYGSHVLISPSADAMQKLCVDKDDDPTNNRCGGVAYINAFGERELQPAWVFPQALSHSPRNIAEAASHEVGHNLGLGHDGHPGGDYYGGHVDGHWAPIMGVGYGKPVVQWSRGAYPGATNAQDDLAVIGDELALRPDEDGATPGVPAAVPSGLGFITSPADVDTFALGNCVAGATVSAQVSPVSPDLDVALTVRDSAGAVLHQADPPSGQGDGVTATGMAAAVTIEAEATDVTVEVAGTGAGSWSGGGYDDYGSLGTYALDVSGCDGVGDEEEPPTPAALPPGAPRDVVASRGDRLAVISWRPPAGGGAVTGYVVSSPSGPTKQVTADKTSTEVTGLTNGTGYEFTVTATGSGGSSTPVSTATVTPAGVPERVNRPRLRVRGHRLIVRWPAAEANGAAIERYQVKVRGTRHRTLSRVGTRAVVRRLPAGRYRVRVVAWNDVGRSVGSPLARARVR